MITIAFTGGGTGGHIYPGLAVASRLRTLGSYRMLWIGSDRGMDAEIVQDAGLDFRGIPSGKLRRYFSLQNITDFFKILHGFFSARRILKETRPALLFSKGGFVSVPPCAAAFSLGIPVITHESDYSPGLATRLSLRFAEQLITSYPDTMEAVGSIFAGKTRALGNPVRNGFFHGDPQRGRAILGLEADARILLVLGGSQGAKQVNDLICGCLPELCKYYTVVHQTGKDQTGIAPAGGSYKPYTYFKEGLPDILAAAELIIGRSGAGTIWEAAASGKPMILIPLSGSGTRGDQIENAEYFRKRGAARVLLKEDAVASRLVQEVTCLHKDEALRTTMSQAALGIGGRDIAEEIAHILLEQAKGAAT